MTEANRHIYSNHDLFLISLTWKNELRVLSELFVLNGLFGSVSSCLEIQRAAGQAGKCLKRGRVAPDKEGKNRCARGMVPYGEDLMGPLLGLVLSSRVCFYGQLPIATSEKEAEKKRSAYTSKEVPREQYLGPHPAAHAWCSLPHGVYCCCPRCGHPPRETSGCPQSEVGRQ